MSAWSCRFGVLFTSWLLALPLLATAGMTAEAPAGVTRICVDRLAPGPAQVPGRSGRHCVAITLPPGSPGVKAAWLLPPTVARQLDRGVAVVRPEGKSLGDAYLEPLAGSASPLPPPLPLFTDLLPYLAAVPFGAEERASFERPGVGLRIACAAGTRPAGLVLGGVDWRLPDLPQVSLAVTASGSPLELGVADAPLRARETSLPLGRLASSTTPQLFPLPVGALDGDTPLSFPLVCPQAAASTHLAGLRVEAPAVARPSGRAAWAWEPAAWSERGDQLLADAARHRVRRLFITVRVTAKGELGTPGVLARFIRRARQQGVQVWAVEGDPQAVLPEAQAGFIARTAAIARYNAAAKPDARLGGVQYDIEPYLLPGYALDPAPWLAEYERLVGALARAAGMPVDLVVPFWFFGDSLSEPVLSRLAPGIGRVTVMAYRTSSVAIQEVAAGAVAWSAAHRKPLSVAIELGPLPDEERFVYAPAAAGTLWVVDLGGQKALVALDRPARNPAGPTFTQRRRSVTAAKSVSFHGTGDLIDRVLPELEAAFSAYYSFDGVSLHGLL